MIFYLRYLVLNKEKGFSLIEVMVGSALLSGAIYFGMNVISNMQESRQVRGQQSLIRFFAIQATQAITTNGHFYPPLLTSSSTDKIIYVACYSGNGKNIPNKNGHRDFQFHLTQNYNENTSTEVCLKDAKYEVRFFWINTDSREVGINILNLLPSRRKNDRLTSRNFKIFAK